MKRSLLALGLCLLLAGAVVPASAAGESCAWPSDQVVRVDDAMESLHMYALLDENGYATNYARVRDVAYILTGTAAQFEVGYYGGQVHLMSGWRYTPEGSEMTIPFTGLQPYALLTTPTDINGQDVELTAVQMFDGLGRGYTYYKLRDLGACLGFSVDWSAQEGIVLSAPQVR